MGLYLVLQNDLKYKKNITKYIKTTKFLRKHLVSKPLNSIAFNGIIQTR